MHLFLPFILALAFLSPETAEAKIVAGSVTNTAANADSTNVNGGYIWLRGADGRDHRMASDNAGNLILSTAGGLTISAALSVGGSPVSSTNPAPVSGTVWAGDATSYVVVTNAAYVSSTHTVTSLNGTSVAGVNLPLQYWVTAAMGGAAIRYSITPSLATAPTAEWLQNFGMYAAATTTTQVTGRWAPGSHLHFISVGATPVSVTASLVQ